MENQTKDKVIPVPDYTLPPLQHLEKTGTVRGHNGVTFVTGEGIKPADIMFITSCVSPQEASKFLKGRDGGQGVRVQPRYLRSDAGVMFSDIFNQEGIDLYKCYYTALVKWLLPKNERIKIPKDVVAWALPSLEEEIALVSPKIIVCIGKPVFDLLSNIKLSLSDAKSGWFYSEKYNAKIYLLDDTYKLVSNPEYIGKFHVEAREIKRMYDEICNVTTHRIPLEYETITNSSDLRRVVSNWKHNNFNVISVDCEWAGNNHIDGKLRSTQFCWAPGKACYVRWMDDKGNYVFDITYKEAGAILSEWLDLEDVKYIGHHFAADAPWLHHVLGLNWYEKCIFDTEFAQQTANEAEDLSLERIAMKYTDLGRYDLDLVLWVKQNKALMADGGYGAIPDEILIPYACLRQESLVQLGDGSWCKIKDLVNSKYAGEVKAVLNGKVQNCKVTNWYKVNTRQKVWKRLVTKYAQRGKHGYLGPVLTPDHKVITQRGKVAVQDIIPGKDSICTSYNTFTSTQLSVFLGCLLGDGGIARRNKAHAGLVMSQCEKRADYLKWKVNVLFGDPENVESKGSLCAYRSKYTPYIAALSDTWERKEALAHSKRKLLITENLLDHLQAPGIAVWYQDDGNLTCGNEVRITIYHLQEQELAALRSWFRSNMGVYVKYRKNQNHICFSVKDSVVFLNYIKDYIHNDCGYKTNVPYNLKVNAHIPGPLYFEPIVGISDVPVKPCSGDGIRYCLAVDKAENFLTKSGFVSNCKDVDTVFRAWPFIYRSLQIQDLLDYYNNIFHPFVTDVFVSFALVGLPMDVAMMDELRVLYTFARDKMEVILREEIHVEAKNFVLMAFATRLPPELATEKYLEFISLIANSEHMEAWAVLKGSAKKPDDVPKLKHIFDHFIDSAHFNIRSSTQLKRWLFNVKCYEPVKSTGNKEKGLPATSWEKIKSMPPEAQKNYNPAVDKQTLQILSEQNNDALLRRLLQLNAVGNICKAFLKEADIDADGNVVKENGLHFYLCSDNRVHGQMSTTETGRPRCVHGDTLIRCFDGFKRIRDIKIGDLVWTHLNRWRKVEDTYIKPAAPMYKVSFENGEVLLCTEEHLLLTEAGKWISVRDVCLQKAFKQSGTEEESCFSLPRVLEHRRASSGDFEYNSAYYLSNTSSRVRRGRIQKAQSDKILELKAGREESLEREEGGRGRDLEGGLRRWLRLFNTPNRWPTLLRTSYSHGRGAGYTSLAVAGSSSCASYRSGSEKQRTRQLSALHHVRAQKYPRKIQTYRSGIKIKGVVPCGSYPVYDISVEEDHSYEASGCFSHNSWKPNSLNWPSYVNSMISNGIAGLFGKLKERGELPEEFEKFIIKNDKGEYKSEVPSIRSCVKAPEGWCFVESDYQTAEIRGLAFVSGDKNLIDIVCNPDLNFAVTKDDKKVRLAFPPEVFPPSTQEEYKHLLISPDDPSLIRKDDGSLKHPKQDLHWSLAEMVHIKPREVLDEKKDRGAAKVGNFSCVNKYTKIRTEKGVLSIEDAIIYGCTYVWDGLDMVSYDSIQYQGNRFTINYQGLSATPDHVVWLSSGEKCCFGEAALRGLSIKSYSGFELDTAGSRHKNNRTHKKRHHIHGAVSKVSENNAQVVAQRGGGQRSKMSMLVSFAIQRPTRAHTRRKVSSYASKVFSRQPCQQLQLQGARHKTNIQKSQRIYFMGASKMAGYRLQRFGFRQSKQRWPLLEGQPTFGHKARKFKKYESFSLVLPRTRREVIKRQPRCECLYENVMGHAANGVFGRRNTSKDKVWRNKEPEGNTSKCESIASQEFNKIKSGLGCRRETYNESISERINRSGYNRACDQAQRVNFEYSESHATRRVRCTTCCALRYRLRRQHYKKNDTRRIIRRTADISLGKSVFKVRINQSEDREAWLEAQRIYYAQVDEAGHVGRAVRRIFEEKGFKLTKEPVYDIINAGPRHRFVASGLLISNSAYGASASTLERKIEQDTGKKPEEGTGQRLLKALEKRQPVAQDFLIKMERVPEKPGYYRAASGRIRHFTSHDPKYLDDIDEHLTMGLFKSMGREARNFPMQESVAATAARAGKWLIDAYIKLNMQARPLIILYDSVVTLCPLEERFKVAQLHQLFMTDENTWEYHGRKMSYPIDTDFVYRWSAKPDKNDKKLLEDKTYKTN